MATAFLASATVISPHPSNNRSGGTDGRPSPAYISSKIGDISANTCLHIALTCRTGCSFGTNSSRLIRQNRPLCFSIFPRMPTV